VSKQKLGNKDCKDPIFTKSDLDWALKIKIAPTIGLRRAFTGNMTELRIETYTNGHLIWLFNSSAPCLIGKLNTKDRKYYDACHNNMTSHEYDITVGIIMRYSIW
jgi:hypothetical protein